MAIKATSQVRLFEPDFRTSIDANDYG